MSVPIASADRVQCWRLEGALGGLELLRADFRRQCFAPHFHDDYTFGLVTRGANRFRYGRQRLVAPVGTVCLAMPGEVHTGDAVDGGWSYWTVHVRPAALAALAADLDGPPGAPVFPGGVITDTEAARRFAAFFAGSRDASAPTTLAHEVRIVEALAFLLRRHADRRPAARPMRDDRVAAQVRDLLAAHAADRVTLAQLELLTGVSRYRLLRAFGAAYGLPPHAWQIQIRLASARSLIRSGVAIATAAIEAGFADQAHLTRLFKRSYGYTPGLLVSGRQPRRGRAMPPRDGDLPAFRRSSR
jgi:AraC-like DNA-binding protein